MTDLQSRIAEAIREAGKLCDDDCVDPAACDAAHPIQAAVLHFDVVTDVYGPVDELAKVAAAVVQPELDRLRAELDRTRAMANQQPCAHDRPHQCHLHLNGRAVHHCPGVLAPEE